MVGVFLDRTASLLLVIVTIFDAILSSTDALIFPHQVATVTLKESQPMPDSYGRGMQFECGRNFAKHAYGVSFDTNEKFTVNAIIGVATYAVVNFNEVEEVMNLVKVEGEPFGFYIKKLKEDVHLLILDNPSAKNVAKKQSQTLEEVLAEIFGYD